MNSLMDLCNNRLHVIEYRRPLWKYDFKGYTSKEEAEEVINKTIPIGWAYTYKQDRRIKTYKCKIIDNQEV